MLESALQKKITKLIDSIGWSVKIISSNKTGTPDTLNCVPMTKKQVLKLFKKQKRIGVFMALEVKNPNGKGVTSPLQKYRIKEIRRAGGIAFVTNSLDKVKKILL